VSYHDAGGKSADKRAGPKHRSVHQQSGKRETCRRPQNSDIVDGGERQCDLRQKQIKQGQP
jgi:hypothetical protein